MPRFGLIGKSLGHSYSARYILGKYGRVIPDLTYENVEIPDDRFLEQFINNTDLEGFNVTIPYKKSIIPFLSNLTQEAKRVGAVNCVKRTKNGWLGHNTDVIGFTRSILPYYRPEWKRAIVLGTGGASQAVRASLESFRMVSLLITRHATKKQSSAIIAYDELTRETIQNSHLIVNTTPVGMFPHTEEMPPFLVEHILPSHFVADIIYNPPETLFLKKCREKGAQTWNGLSMLYFQADASVEFWMRESL